MGDKDLIIILVWLLFFALAFGYRQWKMKNYYLRYFTKGKKEAIKWWYRNY